MPGRQGREARRGQAEKGETRRGDFRPSPRPLWSWREFWGLRLAFEFVLTPAGAGLSPPTPTRSGLAEGLPEAAKLLGSLGLCAGVAAAEDVPPEESRR